MKRVEQAKQDFSIELATLLGWTNIVTLGDTLLGTPVDGAMNSRGQARVPDWTGDWSDCGELIEHLGYLDFHLSLSPEKLHAFWKTSLNDVSDVCEIPDLQRLYIVHQYIGQIKHHKLKKDK